MYTLFQVPLQKSEQGLLITQVSKVWNDETSSLQGLLQALELLILNLSAGEVVQGIDIRHQLGQFI